MLAVHPVTLAPARESALRVLGRIRRDRSFLGPVLSAELASSTLDPKDIALITRLVHGVLASSGVLDAAIARHARRSPEPLVADALRLGTYELLFARAPAYAVVDQTVDAVRRVRRQAAPMANAVMRRIAEDSASFPWGDPLTDLDALARQTAHPRWLVDVLFESLGAERAREALYAAGEPAPAYIRLDPFSAERTATLEALEAAAPLPSPPDPDCYVLESPARAYTEQGRRGWFAMDAAAQMAPALLGPAPDEELLDLGSGRGNKTICLQSIAIRRGGPAHITALDLHEHKTSALKERLAGSSVPGVTCVTADALHLTGRLQDRTFDAVLVDAPCTGLGTLRRYPEKRWRLTPDDIPRMAILQRALLESAASVVRPGGRLVYSTCSVAAAENRDVVQAFLGSAAGAGFCLQDVRPGIAAAWEMFVDADGCFQSWPRPGGPDGHYVAVLRRATA